MHLVHMYVVTHAFECRHIILMYNIIFTDLLFSFLPVAVSQALGAVQSWPGVPPPLS